MGQYYRLYNITKGTSSEHLGKWGEFNPYEIMLELGWTMEDAVEACGDYGTRHNLTEAAELLDEEHMEQPESQEDRTTDEDLMWWCAQGRKQARLDGTYVSEYGSLDEMASRWGK